MQSITLLLIGCEENVCLLKAVSIIEDQKPQAAGIADQEGGLALGHESWEMCYPVISCLHLKIKPTRMNIMAS